jgi:putative phage-type endonuclease
MTVELIQGSEEWLEARKGSLGASQIADVVARGAKGWGLSKSRATLMRRLLGERLTGQRQAMRITPEMQHGIDTEPVARVAYEFYRGVSVAQVGLVLHPTIKGSHASPDGLVGDDGLVEIKCRHVAGHLEMLEDGAPSTEYVLQCHWQMICTGRAWCDLAYFNPFFAEHLKLKIIRIERDQEMTELLEGAVTDFLNELNRKVTHYSNGQANG